MGTKSAVSRASAAPGSCLAAFMPPFTRRRRTSLGGAHAVVKGDGDVVWGKVVTDCALGAPQPVYEGGKVDADSFVPARWDLIPPERYMWASVQTVRGCPKHCSFCSVWRTDGQKPRQRGADAVIEEIVELRRLGFRFIALADDNFYPVTLDRYQDGRRGVHDPAQRAELEAIPRRAFRADGKAREAAERHDVLHADHDGSGRGSASSSRR